MTTITANQQKALDDILNARGTNNFQSQNYWPQELSAIYEGLNGFQNLDTQMARLELLARKEKVTDTKLPPYSLALAVLGRSRTYDAGKKPQTIAPGESDGYINGIRSAVRGQNPETTADIPGEDGLTKAYNEVFHTHGRHLLKPGARSDAMAHAVAEILKPYQNRWSWDKENHDAVLSGLHEKWAGSSKNPQQSVAYAIAIGVLERAEQIDNALPNKLPALTSHDEYVAAHKASMAKAQASHGGAIAAPLPEPEVKLTKAPVAAAPLDHHGEPVKATRPVAAAIADAPTPVKKTAPTAEKHTRIAPGVAVHVAEPPAVRAEPAEASVRNPKHKDVTFKPTVGLQPELKAEKLNPSFDAPVATAEAKPAEEKPSTPVVAQNADVPPGVVMPKTYIGVEKGDSWQSITTRESLASTYAATEAALKEVTGETPKPKDVRLALALIIARANGIESDTTGLKSDRYLQVPDAATIKMGVVSMQSGILHDKSISYAAEVQGKVISSLVSLDAKATDVAAAAKAAAPQTTVLGGQETAGPDGSGKPVPQTKRELPQTVSL